MPLPIGTSFADFPTDSLGNEHIRLDYLTGAGPRLVRLYLPGMEENQLGEASHLHVDTPHGLYRFFGGHRLWHAPEAMPRTYYPDNEGLEVEKLRSGIRLTGVVEPHTGLQKTMEIHLEPGRPAFHIRHILKNTGSTPVELAPWAITQLPLGGATLLPLSIAPLDAEGLLPNRNLVLWPYTKVKDPRLEITDELVLLHGAPAAAACKFGYANRTGWAGYIRPNLLLIKTFAPFPDLPHPDFSCSVETYTGPHFIELETLGPMQPIQPGSSVDHTEHWEYFTGFHIEMNASAVSRLLHNLGISWK